MDKFIGKKSWLLGQRDGDLISDINEDDELVLLPRRVGGGIRLPGAQILFA